MPSGVDGVILNHKKKAGAISSASTKGRSRPTCEVTRCQNLFDIAQGSTVKAIVSKINTKLKAEEGESLLQEEWNRAMSQDKPQVTCCLFHGLNLHSETWWF